MYTYMLLAWLLGYSAAQLLGCSTAPLLGWFSLIFVSIGLVSRFNKKCFVVMIPVRFSNIYVTSIQLESGTFLMSNIHIYIGRERQKYMCIYTRGVCIYTIFRLFVCVYIYICIYFLYTYIYIYIYIYVFMVF